MLEGFGDMPMSEVKMTNNAIQQILVDTLTGFCEGTINAEQAAKELQTQIELEFKYN
jgi:hypothetical protein